MGNVSRYSPVKKGCNQNLNQNLCAAYLDQNRERYKLKTEVKTGSLKLLNI